MADVAPWTPPASDKVAWTPPAEDKAPRIALDPVTGQEPNAAEYGLRQKEAIAVRNRVRQEKENFVTGNAQPGVPLDTESGLPASVRLRLSPEGDIDKATELLSKQEGIISARKSANGDNVIARINDENGKPKDVLLHPMNKRIDLGAVAGEAVPLTKMGVAGGLALATEGLSLPLTATVMGLGTGGYHALSEGGSRLAAGQELAPGQIAKEAAVEGGINAALPLAGAGIKKVASGVQKLFTGGAGQLEAAVPAAAERLGVPTFPSEVTGSKVLARSENAAGLKDLNATQAGAMKAAEDRQLGLSGRGGVPSEEQVATQVQPLAAKNAATAEAGVTGAKDYAAKAAQDQIQATLDSGLVPSNLDQSKAGSFLRGKLENFAQGVKAEAEKNYPAFYQKAAEKGVTLDAKPVSDLVAQIAKEDPSGAAELLSPSIKQVKAVEGRLNPLAGEGADTGMVDQFGRAIKSAPEAPPPLGFQEAINLRAIVRKKLAAGFDALGDPVKRYYSKLNNALTETIDNGIQSDKSGELQKLYDKARASYSEGAQALEQGKLPKLFADAGDAGHVADDQIVPKLFTGQGNLEGLKAWKSVLDPKEYSLLLRQGVKHLMDSSPGTGGFIDAGKFLGKLDSLAPEVRTELLGPLAKDVTGNAKLLAAARGAKIDPADLADALQSAPGAAPRLLQEAFAREKAFDVQYNNSIQQALRGGKLGPSTLGNVDRFTSDWLDKAGAADVRQAMGQIAQASPEAAEAVRSRALQNILDSSRAPAEVGQITTGGNPMLDAAKLVKYTTGAEREKYQAVLGKQGIQFLDDLATVSEAQAKRIAQGEGKPLSAEALAERGSAIGEGNGLSLARTAGRALLYLPEATLGNAERNAAVSNYLKTGQLPSLFSKPAKAAILAAPEAIEQTRQISKDRPGTNPGRVLSGEVPVGS